MAVITYSIHKDYQEEQATVHILGVQHS